MSLKQFCVLSVLACSLSSPCVTSAADLSVNGYIQPGGACGIALGNGGIVDLGNLSSKDVSSLPNRTVIRNMPLTINCPHPTKVGVDTIDNRAGTRPPEWAIYPEVLGLGNPAIGYYDIFSPPYGYNSLADGRRVVAIWRKKGKTTWEGAGDSYGNWAPNTTMSWELGSGPVAFKTLTDVLKVRVRFEGDIAFTDELEIDGSATLELVYL
ncbi:MULTISPECIES: DUF1120 domain-containing protein [Burkholderia]|uniref:Molecular chaperone n=1 Tax=Burkholderia aenigmatica TaxID=2015348 RepID=A0A228HUC4_9BURK|nr:MULTISPECIES: DUF1120 domain-containing protein [Burkholderia]MBN3842375.1 DUF1120 domain-containing protein [Burkholderia sp. Ac-20349]OXI33505.1 molecular chaperone [Burkholderia aenigmatica]